LTGASIEVGKGRFKRTWVVLAMELGRYVLLEAQREKIGWKIGAAMSEGARYRLSGSSERSVEVEKLEGLPWIFSAIIVWIWEDLEGRESYQRGGWDAIVAIVGYEPYFS
jgi:hypothetical protein